MRKASLVKLLELSPAIFGPHLANMRAALGKHGRLIRPKVAHAASTLM